MASLVCCITVYDSICVSLLLWIIQFVLVYWCRSLHLCKSVSNVCLPDLWNQFIIDVQVKSPTFEGGNGSTEVLSLFFTAPQSFPVRNFCWHNGIARMLSLFVCLLICLHPGTGALRGASSLSEPNLFPRAARALDSFAAYALAVIILTVPGLRN